MTGRVARRESRADFEALDPYARSSAGKSRFLCPFAECATHQNPKADRSLCYNDQNGLWHCWRCDAKGQDPAFWKQPSATPTGYQSPRDRKRETLRRAFAVPAPKPKSLDVPGVSKHPENQAGTEPSDAADISSDVPPVPDWILCMGAPVRLIGTPGAAYLESRGLPAEYCQNEGVRFSPDYYSDKTRNIKGRPAVIFPLMDESGRAVAAQGRFIHSYVRPKAMHTRGGMNGGLFDTQGAFDSQILVIVEAPIDAFTLDYCGLASVATCGASNFPDRLKRAALNRVVLLAHDADEAGDKAAVKITGLLALAAPLAVLRLRPADGFKDWNAQLQGQGPDTLAAFLSAFVSANVEHLLPAVSPAADSGVAAPVPAPPAPTVYSAVPAALSCPFGDVPPYDDIDGLFAFVQAVHWGTGLDIRQAEGRVVIVERGLVTSVWAEPASGRLATGSDYWKPIVKPFVAVGQIALGQTEL